MWFLGRLHAITASKNLLVDKDVESFKKNMYIFAKLSILGKESRDFLGWDRISFWGIIMSNNPVLLEIKGDWEKVIERSDIYLLNPSKEPYHKYTYLEFEFLKALAKKDIDKMKESINSMLDIKIARKMLYDMENYFDFYLQIFALIYLKIALYHGIDLGIDSDIAPKELIDNTPADSYPEPYDFMKDFDFKVITAEEWKNWIYKYHKNPEKLKEEEEEGYFI